MNCPECKGSVELELTDELHDKDYRDIILANAYHYKCPNCKTEFDPENLEE